jgi:ferric-dicitrate binding protein FerR (iron transport regulator)
MSQHRDLDVTKRDRFELLSAYLDGEVSPSERRLVMTWLADDPETQCLYRRLLHLRQGFQGICHTSWQVDTDQRTAATVIRRINHRFRLTCMAGLTAAAVAVVGVFSGALHDPMGRLGGLQTSNPGNHPHDSLEIALDQPPIMIPKPAVVTDMNPIDTSLPNVGSPHLMESTL